MNEREPMNPAPEHSITRLTIWRHWLGLSILLLWLWSAIFAICGWFDGAWILVQVWIVLLVCWCIRWLVRIMHRVFSDGPMA